ncbi:MAG: hypothetical protein ACI8QC_000892 [Planctomycetota bacterium]|jgi:hypothetical protein
MSNRTKTLPLLGLLGLLVLGAVALTQLGGGAAPQESVGLDASTQVDDTAPERGPVVESDQLREFVVDPDSFTDTTVVYPLEVELTLVQAGASVGAKDLAPARSGANARLDGLLFAGDDGLSGTVTFIHGPNQGRVLRTDSTGAFGASDLYPGISIVRVDTSRGWTSERQILLRGLAKTPLQVGFGRGGLAVVQGTVLNTVGKPLEGAQVRLDGNIGLTDSDGIFRFNRITPGKVMAVVEAEGFARYLEIIAVARATVVEAHQVTFRLKQECILEVTVAEDLGHPGPAHLYLFPASGARLGRQNMFPWYLVNPIEIYPGGAKTIGGLGAGPVTAMLFKPGAMSKPRRTSVRLYSERPNQLELHLEATPGLRGKVLYEGKPKRDIEMLLEAPDAGNATSRLMGLRPTFNEEMIMPHLPAGVQTLKSDARGGFHFTTWGELNERLYLSARSTDGKLYGRRLVKAGEQNVELILEPVRTQTGRVDVVMRGRYQGLPVRVMVQGEPRDPFVLPAGEDLRIEDLEPGEWRLDVRWRDQVAARGVRLDVQAGGMAEHLLVLPKPAVEGQTPEQRTRAGR